MCGARKCLFRATMRIQLFTNITKTKRHTGKTARCVSFYYILIPNTQCDVYVCYTIEQRSRDKTTFPIFHRVEHLSHYR